MNFLENNQKAKIRLQRDDITLYEPTTEQKIEVRKMIESDVKLDEELNVTIDVDLKCIRYIIRELCEGGSFIDDYTDKEIEEKFSNGNGNLQVLRREIEKILGEISEEMIEEQINILKKLQGELQYVEVTKEANKVKEGYQKIMGDYVNVDELIVKNIQKQIKDKE